MGFVIKKKDSSMVISRIGTGSAWVLGGSTSFDYISVLCWALVFATAEEAKNVCEIAMNDYDQADLEVVEVVDVNGIRKYKEEA